MNIVRFNDPFEAALRVWNSATENVFKDLDWQHSPLFEYATTREKERGFIREIIDKYIRPESCPWPFEMFRLAITETSKGWVDKSTGQHCGSGRFRCDLVIMRRAERIFFLGNAIQLFDETPTTIALSRRYNPLIIYMHDAFTSADNPQEYAFRYGLFASGRWLPAATDCNDLAMGMIDSIVSFIMDCMVPTNYLAEVHPNEPGRSVAWIKSRTHYTLITHGHPANRREVQSGERVKSDPEGELTRMAGKRRAHYKHLRHPRFRFARNEERFPGMPKGTIYVRETWVGPKEWKDEGGRQIYRILEPIAEETTTRITTT